MILRRAVSTWVLALLLPACALTSKGDPLSPRYFSAEPRGAAAAPSPPTSAASPALELRLGRVASSAFLGERIVHRDSASEVAFYDEFRWSERPETYVRRALSGALYDRGRVARILSGSGPTLDVDLLDFSEVTSPQHLVRIRIAFVLHEEHAVRLAQTLQVERPVASADPRQVADAMSEALDGIASQIADRVQQALGASPVAK